MRKNNTEVTNAFIARRACNKFAPIHTDGETIFSYATPIAKHVDIGVLVDVYKYSTTTTRQQNDIQTILTECGIPFTTTTESLKN